MQKQNWIWMPHAAHFIGGNYCRFHLATYVGGYIVSTVGELFWDSTIRENTAKFKGIILKGKGDERDRDYMKKIGFEEIGCGRLYETMVFKAGKSKHKCCPYEATNWGELDFQGYNTPEDAYKGHLKMCKKWSKKK